MIDRVKLALYKWGPVIAWVLMMALFLFLTSLTQGCGVESHSPQGTTVVTKVGKPYLQRWEATLECTGLPGDVEPYVILYPTADCPCGGKHRCLADGPDSDQPIVGDNGCGVYGRYYKSTLTIILPDEFPDALGHELVHHLLYVNTGDSDGNHESDYFVLCKGGPIDG